MKRLIVQMFIAMLPLVAIAKPVTESTARRVAYHFLTNATGVEEQELRMVYSQKLPQTGHSAFYTFSASGGGFAIVAGDDVALPILAYSYENPFGEDVPDHVASFLADYTGALDAAIAQDIPTSIDISKAWDALRLSPAESSSNEVAMGPFITTQWSQHPPYNNACPQGGSNNAKVGCGAVALGQLIRFWQYPTHPRGFHDYTESNFGYHSIDFDSINYNYSLMPNILTTTAGTDSISETARFLYHVGVSINMNYGISASGVFAANIASALINNFKFSPLLGDASRSEYEDTVWEGMILTELNQQRPLIYRGANTDGSSDVNAHIWVCDGYDSTGHFHFNFGWNGLYDGYYALTAITPGSANYTYAQAAVLGIAPDSLAHTIRCLKAGSSQYIVSDTIDVYKQRTLNIQNGYEYSGYAGNGNRHTMTFVPSDRTKQLKIEVLDSTYYKESYYSYYLALYDGENRERRLDGPTTPHATDFPMITSHNALVIVDSSSMNAHGYAFRITQYSPTFHTITATVSDASMGSVLGGGTFLGGDTAVLTALPASGFRFLQWNDGNTDNPRSIVVTSDSSFTASFGAIPVATYALTVLSDDVTMGQVAGGGTFTNGDNITIRATPFTGFRFLRWNDGNTDNPRSIVVTSDSTFTAFFEAIPATNYTLTVISDDETAGTVWGGGNFTEGETAQIAAIAHDGYIFTRWNDGNTDNPRSVIVTADSTFTAFFTTTATPTYTITVFSNDNTMGQVAGGGTFASGDNITISASPFTGYHFLRWNDGNTDNPRSIVVTSDSTFTAFFEAVPATTYTLTVISDNETAGTVWGGGTFSEGEVTQIAAIPHDGYLFARWNDDNEDNPRTVTVTADATYIAHFERREGIDDATLSDIHIYVNGKTIHIDGLHDRPARLYDMLGRCLAEAPSLRQEYTFEVPQAGIYLIKIEKFITIKVSILQ